MELYKELLINALDGQKIEVTFPNLKINAEKIVELKCYNALKQIKEVLEDESLEDKECFDRIERIICILEKEGTFAGIRHDFG